MQQKIIPPAGVPHSPIDCVISDLRYLLYSGVTECLANDQMQYVK
jgi:hypothetical protein